VDGFERRRAQKKTSILNAALELFKQYGFNKVTVAEIAKKASVSQVSIYNFFDSKENLRHELLMKLMDDYSTETSSIFNHTESVKIKLEKLLASTSDFIGRFSVHFMLDSIESDPIVRARLQEERTTITEQVVHLIETGKNEGVLDTSVSTRSMVIFLEIFQDYFNHHPASLAGYVDNPQLYSEISSLFIKALMNKEDPDRPPG